LPNFLTVREAAVAPGDFARFYRAGRIRDDARIIWQALEDHGPLATLELRNACRMDTKAGNKRFKRAILDLQCLLVAVHFGAEQETKCWASGRHELTYRAFPKQNEIARRISVAEAQRNIAGKLLEQQPGIRPLQIARIFGWLKAEAVVACQAAGQTGSKESSGTHRTARSKVKLILASASPRRAEVLRDAGFEFEVQPAKVDESRLPDEAVEAYVLRVATAKADAIAQANLSNGTPAIVIAADTVVLAGREILPKPKDAEDARRMLRLLSASTHEVVTGLFVIRAYDGISFTHVERTRVEFTRLSETDIDSYIQTKEPFDKAGAYGIQGVGGRFVRRIDGCYFNVMGLPLSRLWEILRQMRWDDLNAMLSAAAK
jgi:nucleoside triphosphate pyrophosphatase